jgi:hypothetical protein
MLHDVTVRPPARYPRAPRGTGSTLFQPQLHSTIVRYTSAYIRKSADESDALFSWLTEPTELRLSVKIKNFSSQCENPSSRLDIL